MPSRTAGGSSQRRWYGPMVLFAVATAVYLAGLWLAFSTQRHSQRFEVEGATHLSGAQVRGRLQGCAEYLTLLGGERAAGTLDAAAFQSRVGRYVADHHEMLCVNWVDADFKITDVAPLEGNRGIIGLHLELPEPKRASHLARESRRPVYTRAFQVIQGDLSVEVWCPVFRGDQFLGLFGGIFSCRRIFEELVVPAARGRYQVTLAAADGTPLLATAPARSLSQEVVHEDALTPESDSPRLRFAGYGRGPLDWAVWAISGLCLVLMLAMVRALTGLKQEVEERHAAEAAGQALEEQLRQARKMESIGRLAGGVAHDFNNVLQVILGCAEMGRLALDGEHAVAAELQNITDAAQRARELTQQLLAFARRQPAAPRILDLNQAIAAMLKMLRRLIGEDVEVVWQPAEPLPAVRFDPSQLDQVLANLCVNARDALGGSGRVTIATAAQTLTHPLDGELAGLPPGEYAVLSVTDTGCGIPPAALDLVFEPFYTTKAPGQGTGLGLATVYGIARQNLGCVTVESAPDTGTTFRVYLPAVTGEPVPAAPTPAPTESANGHETILVVEDDADILALAVVALGRRGYTVLSAASPAEALPLAASHPSGIDLLVTDVVMPGMHGGELAARLLALRPGLKVLYVSGYTADAIAQRGVVEDGVALLPKPFSLLALTQKVREVLDSDGGTVSG